MKLLMSVLQFVVDRYPGVFAWWCRVSGGCVTMHNMFTTNVDNANVVLTEAFLTTILMYGAMVFTVMLCLTLCIRCCWSCTHTNSVSTRPPLEQQYNASTTKLLRHFKGTLQLQQHNHSLQTELEQMKRENQQLKHHNQQLIAILNHQATPAEGHETMTVRSTNVEDKAKPSFPFPQTPDNTDNNNNSNSKQ